VILQAVISKLEIPPSARILEVGAGTGGNLEMLSQFGAVDALEMDATARAIAERKSHGRFRLRPGRCPDDLPFDGEQFDLICLFDVLEHIAEDTQTLVQLRRLLVQGGRILVTVPAFGWMWSRHDEFLHHKRRYTGAQLRSVVTAAGLRLDRMSYFNTLLFPLALLTRSLDRLVKPRAVPGTTMAPGLINSTLAWTFRKERFLLGRLNLPFGLSLLAVASIPD
jgi:SAM-dependent methyltransferase